MFSQVFCACCIVASWTSFHLILFYCGNHWFGGVLGAFLCLFVLSDFMYTCAIEVCPRNRVAALIQLSGWQVCMGMCFWEFGAGGVRGRGGGGGGGGWVGFEGRGEVDGWGLRGGVKGGEGIADIWLITQLQGWRAFLSGSGLSLHTTQRRCVA